MSDDLSPAAIAHIRDVIAAGPFGNHVGMSVDDVARDHVTVRMPEAEHVLNGVGIVHGGATATLIDTAATAAAWATPDARPTTRGTTVALTINYVGAGAPGDLIADARAISRGGTLTIVDVVVKDQSDQLVAKAQITYKLDLARDRRLEQSNNAIGQT